MNIFTKPAVTVLITTLMILSSCVCFCFADDQTDGFKTVSLPVDRYESDTPLDNDELFEGYVDSLLGSDTTKKYAAKRRARLTGINLAIYEKIKPEIAEVANGSRTSTVFEVSLDELRLEKNGWTAEELGVAAIVQDGEVTKEAIDALVRVIGLDFDAILNTLLVESPFELYWFDKVSGTGIDGGDIGVRYAGEELILELDSGFLFEFSVAQGYAAGPYEVDMTNIERVNRAIDKAAAVVDAYKNENDYLRLLAYKNTICDFVEYDYNSAGSINVPYGDPWQIISVFDDDPDTNVVCEGYSKAFQYLCDLTEFKEDINCISVIGTTSGGTGAGDHMWNIVNMEDGKNYLVDVTNCDEGTVGEPDLAFLAGYSSGNIYSGYSLKYNGTEVKYCYDSETAGLYDSAEIELSDSHYFYDPPAEYESDEIYAQGSCGANVDYALTVDGTVTISGTGPMDTDYYLHDLAKYRSVIKRVIVQNGVTDIGQSLFKGCERLDSVYLPDSITGIGPYAFYGCPKLADEEGFVIVKNVLFNYYGDKSEVNVPDGVREIGNEAFRGNRNVKRITLPEGLEDIHDQAFRECTQLEKITFPHSLKIIRRNAYFDCQSLKSAELPHKLAYISDGSFGYGTNAVIGGFSISGYKGTLAEEYAIEHGIPFRDISSAANIVEPTCTSYGYTTCPVCGEVIGKTVPAKGHKWNAEYTVDKAATYFAAGSKSIHCSICGNKKPGSAVTVPKLKVKTPTLAKPAAAKKGFTVKWKKVPGAKGYVIQYALNSKFTRGRKTVVINKAAAVSKKVSKLKAKKKYYVRIRAYRTVSGKKIYSSWTRARAVKTR